MKTRVKLHYSGSKGWLIFWMVVWFPLALVLLLTGSRFEYEGKAYLFQYDGSRGWICFWTLALFPVAALLLLLNGFSVNVETLLA